jgi:hypothetical protein
MKLSIKATWQDEDGPPNVGTLSLEIPDAELTALLEAFAKALASPAKRSEPKPKAVGSTLHFDAFWSLYPAERRLAKAMVLAKWKSANLDKDWEEIRTYIHAELPKWAKDNFKYCPLVTTFVNQKRWTGVEPQQTLAQIV